MLRMKSIKHWRASYHRGQARVYHLIAPSQDKDGLGTLIYQALVWLIMFNLVFIIFESFEELDPWKGIFFYFEVFSVIIFSLEYLLHCWTAPLRYPRQSHMGARVRYVFSFMGIVDLLSILPFYLPFFIRIDLRALRALRLVRLLRVFKLNRYSPSLALLAEIIEEKKQELSITIFLTFILLLVASTLMYHLEHEIQPERFPNVGATFWWAVATLTTVGYGDVYPVTNWGRFLSGCIALLGIGIVALPTSILSASYLEKLQQKTQQKKTEVPLHLLAERDWLRSEVARLKAELGYANLRGQEPPGKTPNPGRLSRHFCPTCGQEING
ncbi:MAG: ion transporter [Microscillaceae bacterium]